MSCVARPHQTPIGAASNFLQRKWVSCSKSYWQGYECYDLAWYKDMEAPCFPQPNLWLAGCASRSWAALRKFVVLSTQRLRVGKKPFIPLRAESVAGLVGAPAAPSVVFVPSCSVLRCLAPSCRLRRLAKWCEMVRDGAGKQQQASSSGQAAAASSKQQQEQQQEQQQASSRQAAGKQQASRQASQQAAAAAASSRQAATSVCPLERMNKYN